MKILGDHELQIEASRVQEFLLYGSEGPWGGVENHVEESQGGIKLSAQAAATLCAIVLNEEESAANVAVTNGMQVEDVMAAVRQLRETGILSIGQGRSPRVTALQGLRVTAKGENVLKKDAITDQHRNALELLKEKADSLEEFDLPLSWKGKLDALFPETEKTERDLPDLDPLTEAEFVALCAIASKNQQRNTPDIKIGQTISVSPTAMVIFHEVELSRANSLDQVAEWHAIGIKKLKGTIRNLVSCGMLLIDEEQATETSAQLDFTSLKLSENAKRTLEHRRCSFDKKALVAQPDVNQVWFTEKGARVAKALTEGEVTPESIAATDIGLGPNEASEILMELESCGLAEKHGFAFRKNTQLEKALLLGRVASAWGASAEPLLSIKKIRSQTQASVNATQEKSTGPKLSVQQKQDLKHSHKIKEEKNTLAKAVRIAQEKLIATLIEKGTRQKRTEFYAYELMYAQKTPGIPEKSDVNIRRQAIEQMFKFGFLTHKNDFAEALQNGIHPSKYQPVAILSPLGDAQGRHEEFEESYKNYENYRTQSYLSAIVNHETQEAGEICKDFDFDEEDFFEFLASDLGKELVGSVTKFDESRATFYKSLALNNDRLKTMKRHTIPIVDYFSSIEPFSVADLTRVFPVQKQLPSEQALIELLTREQIIEELLDKPGKYTMATDRPEKEIRSAMERAWRKVKKGMNLVESIPEEFLRELHANGFASARQYGNDVKRWLDPGARLALQSTNTTQRFHTNTGKIDYFFLDEQMRSLPYEQFKNEIEKTAMGTGRQLLTNETLRKDMTFSEFTSRIKADRVQLNEEEKKIYSYAKAVWSKRPQRTDEKKAELDLAERKKPKANLAA